MTFSVNNDTSYCTSVTQTLKVRPSTNLYAKHLHNHVKLTPLLKLKVKIDIFLYLQKLESYTSRQEL